MDFSFCTMKPDRIDVNWTPELERELRKIFGTVRYTGRQPAHSEADLIRKEKCLCAAFVRAVRRALERTAPETHDLELLEAIEKVRLRVADRRQSTGL